MEKIASRLLLTTQKMYAITDEHGNETTNFWLSHDDKGNITINGAHVTSQYIFANAHNVIETDRIVLQSTEYPDGYMDITDLTDLYMENDTPMPRCFYEDGMDAFIDYVNDAGMTVEIMGIDVEIDTNLLENAGIFWDVYNDWIEKVQSGEYDIPDTFMRVTDADIVDWMDAHNQHMALVVLDGCGIYEIAENLNGTAGELTVYIESLLLEYSESGRMPYSSQIWKGVLTVLSSSLPQ